jgi:cell division protein FtsB
MSEEERKKLCEELRTATPGNVTVKAGYRAADEIERLAAENEQLKRRIAGLESEITCMSYDLIR